MQRLQAFKYELMPNGEQQRVMRCFAGSCRSVYNKALAWQNEQYQADNSFKFSYYKIANLLPEWKRELVWLKDCHSQVLQQSLKDLESSFKNFFARRVDFPKFKKKGTRKVSVTRRASSWNREITAFGCLKSVGCAIAIAGWWTVS